MIQSFSKLFMDWKIFIIQIENIVVLSNFAHKLTSCQQSTIVNSPNHATKDDPSPP